MPNMTQGGGSFSVGPNRGEEGVHQHHPLQGVVVPQLPPPRLAVRRRRSLPGTPDPNAEVIALSPKALMASNRFVCEICRKGFQRDQNLQLHRRGHNLPWKLRQRASTEVARKKVYVCPEPSCLHHCPSRALGDLTGIKKHYSRKHGEKKWKCDKCSKKYAVLSDWKAHSKACRSREYRCDCGTTFSRREDFITHRDFCDALAQQKTKLGRSLICPMASSPQGQVTGVTEPINTSTTTIGTRELSCSLKSPLPRALFDSLPPASPASLSMHDSRMPSFSPGTIHSSTTSSCLQSSREGPMGLDGLSDAIMAHPASLAHMSATSLLQKAAQVGVTVSCGGMDSADHMIQGSFGTAMAGIDWTSGTSPCGPMAHGPCDLLRSQQTQHQLVGINEGRTATQFYGTSLMNDIGVCSMAATVFTSSSGGYLKNAEHYGGGGAGGASGWGYGDVMTLDFLGVGEEGGF